MNDLPALNTTTVTISLLIFWCGYLFGLVVGKGVEKLNQEKREQVATKKAYDEWQKKTRLS